MTKMRVAILGASGFGKFHAREFNSLGCDIVAILGKTKESAEKAAQNLQNEFGIKSVPYHDLGTLLAAENLDAVSVCTPPTLHEEHVRMSLNNSLHVLCEKPFILNGNNYADVEAAKKLFEIAKQKNKILTVNTQWPSIIPYVASHIDVTKISRFYASIETGKIGMEVLTEHLPHANSVLLHLVPPGEAEQITFPIKSGDANRAKFHYATEKGACSVIYDFRFTKTRPRRIAFSFDGHEFSREVYDGYKQRLRHDGGLIEIEDPLHVSIRSFVESVANGKKTLVSESEVLENMRLQNAIIEKYAKT